MEGGTPAWRHSERLMAAGSGPAGLFTRRPSATAHGKHSPASVSATTMDSDTTGAATAVLLMELLSEACNS